MKLIQGFKSLNASQRMFFISIFIACSYTIYLLFNFVPISIWSLWLSVVVFILCYIYLSYYAAYPNKWKKGDIILLLLTFITVLFLPFQFIATAKIAYKKEFKDDLLMKIDKVILGWLIKDGQVSLYIDQNNFIGPHTTLGKFLNNTLQIVYFYYYIIPYISMHFFSLANCGKEVLFRFQNKGKKSVSYTQRWSNTHFIFGTYLLTCDLVFFTNTIIPASSPRLYLSDKFIHPLNLSGFAKYLNSKTHEDKSANSFPSGHVAEILTIGLAYILTGNIILGVIVIFFSFLIAMATLFLRYHYFCDILAAMVCAFIAIIINYFFGYRIYLKKKGTKKLKIKNINRSLGIINVNMNMDIAKKGNKPDSDAQKDKNHAELVEEKY